MSSNNDRLDPIGRAFFAEIHAARRAKKCWFCGKPSVAVEELMMNRRRSARIPLCTKHHRQYEMIV